MRFPLTLLGLLLLAACSRAAPSGPAPHQIRLVGASAGLPFAEDVAERFTLASAEAIAPLAQADGSASGIARFCAGLGTLNPDLAIVTRPMTAAELRNCAVHGIARVAAVPFGWTAPVLVARAGEGPDALTAAEATAAIAGPARRWSDLAQALPATAILLYGPARAIVAGDALGWTAGAPVRRDAAYHALGADADLVASTAARTPDAVGIVPFAYAGRDGLRAIPIDGTAPTVATIASGRYPGRAPLILLAKAGEARAVPGMPAMLALFAHSLDPGGAFAREGLVPLDRDGRAAAKRALAAIAGAAIL